MADHGRSDSERDGSTSDGVVIDVDFNAPRRQQESFQPVEDPRIFAALCRVRIFTGEGIPETDNYAATLPDDHTHCILHTEPDGCTYIKAHHGNDRSSIYIFPIAKVTDSPDLKGSPQAFHTFLTKNGITSFETLCTAFKDRYTTEPVIRPLF